MYHSGKQRMYHSRTYQELYKVFEKMTVIKKKDLNRIPMDE